MCLDLPHKHLCMCCGELTMLNFGDLLSTLMIIMFHGLQLDLTHKLLFCDVVNFVNKISLLKLHILITINLFTLCLYLLLHLLTTGPYDSIYLVFSFIMCSFMITLFHSFFHDIVDIFAYCNPFHMFSPFYCREVCMIFHRLLRVQTGTGFTWYFHHSWIDLAMGYCICII